jgi:uncharacterized membrane protein YdcZ (DUF606 family)
MIQAGLWAPYSGTSEIVLAALLFVISGILVYLGIRLRQPVGVARPGRTVSVFLWIMLGLSVLMLFVAVSLFGHAVVQQYGRMKMPRNPITPITATSAVVTFCGIVFLKRRSGFIRAVYDGIVCTMAAPMFFEVPFDLIVMPQTHPPLPALQYSLLLFLPLMLVIAGTFALLTTTPSTRLSKYTLFLLAAMFFVFAAWAMVGFSYPSNPWSFTFNSVSKVLSFLTGISLFVPLGHAQAK